VGFETPPTTDVDYSSQQDTDIDSEFVSERELESDSDLDSPAAARPLVRIEESPAPESPLLNPVQDDSWSVLDEDGSEDGADEEFETSSEFESALGNSVEALGPALASVSLSGVPDTVQELEGATEGMDERIAQLRSQHVNTTPRRRDWASGRSPSSPSQSPVRRRAVVMRKRRGAKRLAGLGFQPGKTLYEYAFL